MNPEQQFNELEMDVILKIAESAYKLNKIPKKYMQNYLLTLNGFLKKYGMDIDVCHQCLGTGKNLDKSKKE